MERISLTKGATEYPGFNVSEEIIKEGPGYDAILSKALDVLQTDFHPSKMYLAEDQALALAKIDYHLKKAMVNHLLGETEAQLKGDDPDKGVYGAINKVYDANQESAYRLAHIIRPRIELIYDLKRHMDKIKRVMGDPALGMPMDPDYKRCIFKLSNTLDYLKQDVAPHVQQFLELTSPGGLEMPFGGPLGQRGPLGPVWAEGLSPDMPGPHKMKGIKAVTFGGGRRRKKRKSSKKKKTRRRKRKSKSKKRKSPARRKSRRRAMRIAF